MTNSHSFATIGHIDRRRTQPVRERQQNLGFSRTRNMTHGKRFRCCPGRRNLDDFKMQAENSAVEARKALGVARIGKLDPWVYAEYLKVIIRLVTGTLG
jgi:hypothetical protein